MARTRNATGRAGFRWMAFLLALALAFCLASIPLIGQRAFADEPMKVQAASYAKFVDLEPNVATKIDATRGSETWCRIDLSDDAIVTISASQFLLNSSSSAVYELRYGDETAIANEIGTLTYIDEAKWTLPFPKGTYYLKVLTNGGGTGSSISVGYSLEDDAIPDDGCAHALEPMGFRTGSVPVGVGQHFAGTLSGLAGSQDVDTFELSIPKAGHYALEVESSPQSFISAGLVKNRDDTQALVMKSGMAETCTIQLGNLAAGTYWLKFQNGGGRSARGWNAVYHGFVREASAGEVGNPGSGASGNPDDPGSGASGNPDAGESVVINRSYGYLGADGTLRPCSASGVTTSSACWPGRWTWKPTTVYVSPYAEEIPRYVNYPLGNGASERDNMPSSMTKLVFLLDSTGKSSCASIEAYSLHLSSGLKSLVNFDKTKVSSIGEGAFEFNSELSITSFPPTLKSVGDYAFLKCTGLTSLAGLGRTSLKTVGTWAFRDCTSLECLTLPKTCTTVGRGAFDGCTLLCKVDFGKGLVSLDFEAFKNCVSLIEVDLPASFKALGTDAFRGCSSLSKLTLRAKVLVSLGASALDGTVVAQPGKKGLVYVPFSMLGTYKGDQSGAWYRLKSKIRAYNPPTIANPMKASTKTVKISSKKVSKRYRVVKRAKAFRVGKAEGKVTFKISGYVTKKARGKFYVGPSGYVTVMRGVKPGVYKMRVKVRAAGTSKYKPVSKEVILTVRVVK